MPMGDGQLDFWSIALGAVLATLGGFAGTVFQEWRNKSLLRRTVVEFSIHMIDTVEHVFERLEEHRKQSGVIWLSLLEAIPIELTVYDRNREHLIRIKDKSIRRELQTFLTNTGVAANGTRSHLLRQLELEQQLSRGTTLSNEEQKHLRNEADAQKRLYEQRYQELKDLLVQKAGPLRNKLSKL